MTVRWQLLTLLVLTRLDASGAAAPATDLRLEAEQVTHGPSHHFFGYIGHAGTCPWNRSGRYIVALQAGFQDHMPRPEEAAHVILIDTAHGNALRRVAETRAWNFQQGTMLYWNPEAPETQFFMNDRDPVTGRVFCVLVDINGPSHEARRLKEFRFPDASIGNSGVAQRGGSFLALNYGRLDRLRPVTGYPGAFDWTVGVNHPADDGLFRIDVKTGTKRLIVSYRQIADALRPSVPAIEDKALFINHSLGNRDDDRIFFYARADFEEARENRLDALFVVHPDGSGLTRLRDHLGGHLDWERGHRMIGSRGDHLALYDTDRQEFLDDLGPPALLGDPSGDKAFAPDVDWLVNGFRERGRNMYVLFRRSDRTVLRSPGFAIDGWSGGPLRIDPAPCWNREGTQILFPAVADDAGRTRQLFRIRVVGGGPP
jgi:hypothetical protein